MVHDGVLFMKPPKVSRRGVNVIHDKLNSNNWNRTVYNSFALLFVYDDIFLMVSISYSLYPNRIMALEDAGKYLIPSHKETRLMWCTVFELSDFCTQRYEVLDHTRGLNRIPNYNFFFKLEALCCVAKKKPLPYVLLLLAIQVVIGSTYSIMRQAVLARMVCAQSGSESSRYYNDLLL